MLNYRAIVCILWIVNLGCLNEAIVLTNANKSNTYFKQISLPQFDKNFTIAPLSAEKLLVLGGAGEPKIFGSGNYRHSLSEGLLYQIDVDGNILTDPNSRFWRYVNPFLTKLSNEDFILNDFYSPWVTRLNADGEELYTKHFNSVENWQVSEGRYSYSNPVIENQDYCYIAVCQNYSEPAVMAGNGLYGILQIELSSGEEKGITKLNQQDFAGTPFYISPLKIENKVSWLIAQIGTKGSNLSDDYYKQHLSLMRLENGSLTNKVNLTPFDTNISESLHTTAIASNGSFIIISGEKSLNYSKSKNYSQHISIRKTDTSFNVHWNNIIKLEATDIFCKNVKESKDGSFVVVGTCKPKSSNYTSGFAIKFSQSGDLIDKQIINLGGRSEFEDFLEFTDGSFLFVGGINNFGKGIEDMDRFFLKTDKNFNY